MKSIKWIGAVLALLVAVVAVVVVVGLKNLDAIVKAVVEEVGTEVTGTQVTLSAAEIGIKEGRAELRGLGIANPEGFSDALLLSVGKVAVDIDPMSLTKDVIVIDEVILSEISFLAEQKELTKTNIEALLKNLESGSTGSGETEKVQDGSAQTESTDVLLAVRKFVFEKSEVKLVSDEWGDLTIPLPPISLQNLGTPENGLTPEQLAQRAMKPVLAQVKKNVAGQLKELAKDKVEEKAKQELQKQLDKNLSESEQEALKSLKGLFK